MNQCIAFNPVSWSHKFPQDGDILEIIQRYTDRLSRGDVLSIGHPDVNGNVRIRKLFLAAMIWGYGRIGYGPHRTHRMLQTVNVGEILRESFDAVAMGNFSQAYADLQINWCGPSFFTKFLYFAGRLCNANPMPLILDSRVVSSFRLLLDDMGLDSRDFAISCIPNGLCFPRRDADGYVAYVNTMNDWALQLGCLPDSLELFLFDPGHPFMNWHGAERR